MTAPQPPAEVPRDPEGLGRASYSPLVDPVKSDADLARAAAEMIGDLRWAGGLGWRWYDEQTGAWSPAPDEAVIEQVRRFMLAMAAWCFQLAAQKVGDSGERGGQFYENLAGTWRKMATASRITAIARLTREIRYTDPAAFDADPDLLNCRNGVADLRTGALLEHSPDYLFTQVAGAD